ncbi:hypothetical protein CH296_27770 [Rhodococcus sp. 14-2496-1d]|nr:hypothetical protein CH296_27770 [Rhodococcus sp. 14-2496-1d]
MCHPVACPTCSKTTWAGCGRHIDSVMKNVPKPQQCSCSTAAADPETRHGLFRSLFRR